MFPCSHYTDKALCDLAGCWYRYVKVEDNPDSGHDSNRKTESPTDYNNNAKTDSPTTEYDDIYKTNSPTEYDDIHGTDSPTEYYDSDQTENPTAQDNNAKTDSPTEYDDDIYKTNSPTEYNDIHKTDSPTIEYYDSDQTENPTAQDDPSGGPVGECISVLGDDDEPMGSCSNLETEHECVSLGCEWRVDDFAGFEDCGGSLLSCSHHADKALCHLAGCLYVPDEYNDKDKDNDNDITYMPTEYYDSSEPTENPSDNDAPSDPPRSSVCISIHEDDQPIGKCSFVHSEDICVGLGCEWRVVDSLGNAECWGTLLACSTYDEEALCEEAGCLYVPTDDDNDDDDDNNNDPSEDDPSVDDGGNNSEGGESDNGNATIFVGASILSLALLVGVVCYVLLRILRRRSSSEPRIEPHDQPVFVIPPEQVFVSPNKPNPLPIISGPMMMPSDPEENEIVVDPLPPPCQIMSGAQTEQDEEAPYITSSYDQTPSYRGASAPVMAEDVEVRDDGRAQRVGSGANGDQQGDDRRHQVHHDRFGRNQEAEKQQYQDTGCLVIYK